MSKIEQAQALRDCTKPHYNCCQSVFIPFAVERGLSQESAVAVAAHFGAGMRRGAACGATTGGLMALGILGKGEDSAKEFIATFKEKTGDLDCNTLLELGEKQGINKKAYCDSLVALAVSLVEELAAKP